MSKRSIGIGLLAVLAGFAFAWFGLPHLMQGNQLSPLAAEGGEQACRCEGGVNSEGEPIDPDTTFCGMNVVGTDGNTYTCTEDGWRWLPAGEEDTGSGNGSGPSLRDRIRSLLPSGGAITMTSRARAIALIPLMLLIVICAAAIEAPRVGLGGNLLAYAGLLLIAAITAHLWADKVSVATSWISLSGNTKYYVTAGIILAGALGVILMEQADAPLGIDIIGYGIMFLMGVALWQIWLVGILPPVLITP